MPSSRTAHLVGSIPLPDSETVFRTVCQALGSSIKRIPDGETGDRSRWIWFQRNMLESHPDMEIDTGVEPFRLFQWDGKLLRETPWIKFKDDADPSTSSFPTGYRDAAVESYQIFARLRDEGVIGPNVRFQVSIPTPMATAYMYISPKAREAYLPAYERALADARISARKEYEDIMATARKEEAELLAKAREEAKVITQEAAANIAKQRATLKKQLEADVEEMARTISDKLVVKV